MPRYGRADAIFFFVRKDEVLRLSEELYMSQRPKVTILDTKISTENIDFSMEI